MQDWLARVGIKPVRIYPGSPWENGYNERFNGTLRRMGERHGREDDAKFNPKPAQPDRIRRAFNLPFLLDTGHVGFLFIGHRLSGRRGHCKHLSRLVIQSFVYS
jgi:transposase InsO family protein